MVYGYARVSTTKQVISRQVENIIRAYPNVDKIYSETYTGTTAHRSEWLKLLKIVEKGDTIVFDSISRMSRNAENGVKDYFMLYERGIDLVFLNEHYIDTCMYKQALAQGIEKTGNTIADIYISATNEVLKILAKQQIQQAFEQAEKEVKDLKKRTRDGMKAKGASIKISKTRTGKTYETARSKEIKSIILSKSKTFGGTLKDKEIIDMLNGKYSKIRNGSRTDLSSTFYKYKKKLLEESGQISGQLQLE